MNTSRQFATYLTVGLITNVTGYLSYLLITYCGMKPELAITVVYTVCATAAFVGNRKYTFQHDGKLTSTGYRYVIAQLAGYLMNLAIIELFSNRLGIAHQVVQAAAIPVIAAFLFLASKLFVFTDKLR